MSGSSERESAGLSKFQAALAIADWDQILEWGKDDKFLLEHYSCLNAYIKAAHELSDLSAVAKAADLSILPKWKKPQRYLFARTFADVERYEEAWAIVQSTRDPDDPSFVKHARRIAANSHSKKLRHEIRREIRDFMGAGSDIKPTASTITFPAPTSQPRELGQAVARLGSRTVPRHLAAFELAVDGVRASAKNPQRPLLDEYRDVFVDRTGQIWREDGSILKTMGKPIATSRREDVPNFAEAFSSIKETRGIYHWLVDRVSNFAWMLHDGGRMMDILLSDRSSEFEAHTLDLLDLHEKVSPVGDAAFVERLIVPRVKFEGLMYWDQVSIVFNRLKEFSCDMVEQSSATPAERIYISRSDAKRRPLANERDIEAALKADGYEIVSFTGMPLWKQFFMASSAREIVAPHGAGLAHLIMCEPGTKVTEIIPVSDGTHKLRFNYARLSLVRGHDYQAWLEPQIGEGDSWSVDTGAFLEFLRAKG